MSHVSDAQEQIASAFIYLNEKYDAHLLEKISTLDNVHKADLTIIMDDGKEQTFTAYRAEHTNAR